MDCVTASDAGVAGSSSTGKEQKFVPFSFIHNPPYLYEEPVELGEQDFIDDKIPKEGVEKLKDRAVDFLEEWYHLCR